ncbi:MAG: hypothetical protein QM817_18360 [Archangium sp.]
MSEKKSQGWSFARILLVTAVVGIVAGTLLGRFTQPDIDPEAIAEEEIRRIMPRGDPITSADPMAPEPASLRGIPPYPGVYPRRMLRSGVAGGPASISWFSTPDPASRVLDFYESAFAAEGRRPVAHRLSPDMGYVAWLEELPDAGLGGGVLHMISAMKQFKQTYVLVSASRPDLALGVRPRLPEGLELPPASTTPQIVDMGESKFANQVIYTRTMNTTPGDVVSFFERQFKDRGFSVTDTSSSAGQASITGQRDGSTVVVVARLEGGHSSVVLTYERAGGSEPQPQEEKR